MKIQNHLSMGLIAAVAALTGCGSSGVAESQAPVAQVDANPVIPTGGLLPGYAPYNYQFQTCGLQPKTVSGLVQTDNVLNIRVKADAAPVNGCYPSGTTYIPYSARYSCARFKVTMQVKTGANAQNPATDASDTWDNRATFISDPLAAPGTQGCTGSKTEQVFNLSNYLFPGHGLVRFQIESVDTNHLCNYYKYCVDQQRYFSQYDCRWVMNWSTYQLMSEQSVCPLKPVYQYHSVAGQLDVQTDLSIL